ncbi:MAG TPA: hypothetical protein VK868_06635 [Pyrinomonadaceae bacterium]|nr:hypothetical protein [Pyrinomonadaceae bacterium]
MKSCPKCNRTFPDEGQKFCTFDGGLLIAPQTFDPNATMRATSIDLNATSERPTSRDLPDPNATIIENYPATVALPRNTGPTTGPAGSAPNTSDISRPATPPPPPPPVTPPPPPTPPAVEPPPQRTTGEVAPLAATVATSAPLPQPAPSAPLPPQPVAKKKSKVPWIIAGVLLFLLLSGGALAGIFFAVVKPRLDEMAAERNPNRPVENLNASTPTPAPSVETPTPAPEEAFVPPPGTVKFENSNEKLDGKLAEHYFDFSFYYPQNWKRDPKSGVSGAVNFVSVDRSLPPDFTQESFAVGWYTSTGTFVGDLSSYPQRAEEYSNSLAKRIPEYKKISEGPTKVNSMQGYEFRWEGLSKGTDRGDLKLWGRVIFLPTGTEGDTTGATLTMLTTSLAGELSSVADVGERGEMPVILDSFRFGKKK